MANKERKKRQKLLEKRLAERKASGHPKNSQTPLPSNLVELSKFILDPKKLTSPVRIDDNVKEFANTINPNAEPVFLDCQPESWSRVSCCHLNVKEYIRLNGGKMVSGYRIWYHEPYYIEGERHSVWTDDRGNLRDVSFSDDGEKRIVFIVDVQDRIEFDSNEPKLRMACHDKVKPLLQMLEMSERMITRQVMSDDESWAKMLTFEEYKRGIRKPKHWINGEPV